jgi:hypothetical protein
LPADEKAVTVTTRLVNRSTVPVTDLRVTMIYDPALREDASPITLPTTDPPLPWAPAARDPDQQVRGEVRRPGPVRRARLN